MLTNAAQHTKQRRFNVGDYVVQFDQIFSCIPLYEHLLSYLARSFNEESLLFLLDVREFKNAQEEIQQVALALKIVDLYIQTGSEKEVNIDGTKKADVIDLIASTSQRDNLNKLLVPTTIFNKLYSIINRELLEDGFPRYVRSQDFTEWAQKKGEEFMRAIAVHVSQIQVVDFFLTEDDLHSMEITDKDIRFIFHMNDDSSDWEAIRVTKRYELERDEYAFLSRKKYSLGPNLQRMGLIKTTGILPYSAEQLLYALVDAEYSHVWDKISVASKTLEYRKLSETQPYSSVISQYGLNLGPLFTRRECITVTSVVFDTVRQCYLLIAKSTTKAKLEDYGETTTRKNVVPMILVSGLTLYKISDNKTRYVEFVFSDVKIGADPSKGILKILYQKHSEAIHAGYDEAIRLRTEKNGGIRPENCKRFLDTLDDFMMRYLPTENDEKTW
jgi:hypothetical protein